MSEASSSNRPSSGRSKSKRSLILQDAKKCHSTSALDTTSSSSSNRKSKSKSEATKSKSSSRRRKSLDNSSSTAVSRSSSSSRRIIKEEASPQQSQHQQQTNELLKKQQRRRGSLDYHRTSSSSSGATSHPNVTVGATNNQSDRKETIETTEGAPVTLLYQSTHSTSRFSTSSISRRHSIDSSTPPRMTRTTTTTTTNNNTNNVASVVVHTCDEKGRCLFHPHIQLRKKSIMGIAGGWKDLYTKCPDCEKQELLEMCLKEKEEIGRLERLLGRLDAHDVEYLNDDGVDDDGNYLRLNNEEGGGCEEEEVGNGGGEKKVVEITFAEGCRLPMTMQRRRSSLF